MSSELRHSTRHFSVECHVHKELEEIASEHFPVWGKTIGYQRNRIDFLLLPEYCEEGVLEPTAGGYTYKRIGKRHKCKNIYCNRYMDAIQSKTRSPPSEPSPLPVQREASDSLLEQSEESWEEPHRSDNLPVMFKGTTPFPAVPMGNQHSVQQRCEFYNSPPSSSLWGNSIIGTPTYNLESAPMNMGTTSSFASGLDTFPNSQWGLDPADQVQQYDHRWPMFGY